MIGNSLCCDGVLKNGVCSSCEEHSSPHKYDCEICNDSGEVSCDERDNEGNWQRGVGTQKCECRLINADDYHNND